MDPQEPNLLHFRATPKGGEYALTLRVPESRMGTFTMPTVGSTTYAACAAPLKPRVNESTLASMVFTHNSAGAEGYHDLHFMPPRTGGADAVATDSIPGVLPSMWWPPVLGGVDTGVSASGVVHLTPYYTRPAYDGPTKILTEEFFSHTHHTLTEPSAMSIMRPEVYDGLLTVVGTTLYDDIRGELHLPRCLRTTLVVTALIIPFSQGSVTYTQASLTIPATNLADWPATTILEDNEVKVEGGYLRRKVTAYKPY